MPFLIVEALEGRTVEQKRGLVKDLTEAVTKNFNVSPEGVHIVLHELREIALTKQANYASILNLYLYCLS